MRYCRVQALETQGEDRNQIPHKARGVWGSKKERNIAVVWLYPASESGVTRSITFKSQPPIEKRNVRVFLLSRKSYSLFVRSHQQKQVEREVRHVSHIQWLTVRSPGNTTVGVPCPTTSIRWLSPTPTLSSPSLTSLKGQLNASCERMHHYPLSTYCLLYTSPSPRDQRGSRMPSSA